MAWTVKNLPGMQETQVRSLHQEDTLEKEMATHSSILAWRIPWNSLWWATVHGVARVKHDLVTKSPPPGYSEIVGMGALSNRVWEESLMKSVNRYSRQA